MAEEIISQENEEVKVSVITKEEGKFKEGIKKHGKKIALVASGVALTTLGFVLGSLSKKENTNAEDSDYDDCVVIELEPENVEE